MSGILFAQSRIITRVVKDEWRNPISNKSISIRGASLGIVTNEKGRFSINVSENNKVLVITAVGLAEKIVKVTEFQDSANRGCFWAHYEKRHCRYS